MERVQDANENILEVFENDIHLYMRQFQDEQGIEDFKTVPQSVWNACLTYIQRHVFSDKSILKQKKNIYMDNNIMDSNYNMYDYDLVYSICLYYIYICNLNYKAITLSGFSKLININIDTLIDWGKNVNKLSSKGCEIYKKIMQEQEDSVANNLIDGRKNPIGAIAYLKHHHNWESPYTSDSNRNKQSLTAAELPKLTAQNSGICSPDTNTAQYIDCSNSGNSSQS